MRFLKQSTAFTFRIGPFVDSTDGVTAETGLTIAQADIQISKAGGAFAQTSASPTTTHDADGWYQCPLTSTDTNTLGALTVQIVVSGAAPVWEHFMVLPANVYDSLVLGTDRLVTKTGIRKNTALLNFPFLMTDSTNHNPMTGLTVTGTRSLDGGTFGGGTIANMTEVANGVYQCDLGAGDLNGDTVILRFTASGADDLLITIVPTP
jgi:hypothetical protein